MSRQCVESSTVYGVRSCSFSNEAHQHAYGDIGLKIKSCSFHFFFFLGECGGVEVWSDRAVVLLTGGLCTYLFIYSYSLHMYVTGVCREDDVKVTSFNLPHEITS